VAAGVTLLLAHFAELCEGAILVDADANVVDERPLPGAPRHHRRGRGDRPADRGDHSPQPDAHGRQEDRPIMLDIMDFGAESFVVSRLPLRDESGAVVGGVGFMLYDDPTHLASVVSRYQRLRNELAEAERKLAAARRTKYTFRTSSVSARPAPSSSRPPGARPRPAHRC
jgi:hypothetical protein